MVDEFAGVGEKRAEAAVAVAEGIFKRYDAACIEREGGGGECYQV